MTVRNDCPLQHKCSTPGIVYQAIATSSKDDIEKHYYGLCETALRKCKAIIPTLLKMRKIGTFLLHLDIKER